MTRREIIFVIIAVLLSALAVWNYLPETEETALTRAEAFTERSSEIYLEPLNLDVFRKDPSSYEMAERNPFTYGVEPISPEELERRQRELEEMRRRAEEEAKRRAEETQKRKEEEKQKPKPLPTFPYSFVGYIGPPNDEIAIFRDGKGFIMAKRGEIIKNQYIIKDIGYEVIEIGFVGTTQTQRYPLVQSAKSTPARR